MTLIYFKNREAEGFAEQHGETDWPVIERNGRKMALNPHITDIRPATRYEQLAFESGRAHQAQQDNVNQ
jgi:hypothetical protein